MSTTTDIESAIRKTLPQELQAAATGLARLVEDAMEGRLTQEQIQARLSAEPSLGEAFRALAGKQVEVSSSVIAFGAGAQMGDVTISGDVAGGNIVKLSLNLGMQQTINVSGQARIEKVVGEEHNTYYTYSTPSRSAQEQRNRRAMLTKVRAIWIEGLLNRSLTDELRIDLNLTDRPDLLNLPLNAVVQELEQPAQALPPGMSISEVFDQVGGELLILGAPGAGKTTLLLELLRDLLKRAERDNAHPIPVIFPLSTWAVERKPLKDWLVDQLNIIYDVPKKIGQGWIDENEILPLLDGLDEVTAEHQDACVGVINTYRQDVGGLAPTAIASRIVDYQALKGRLKLRGAVLVETLTKEQVEDYLAKVGESLRAVRELVESDPEVMELLDSPLMLSVVTLALQGVPAEALRAEGTVEERRGRLWEAYIERMMTRKGKEAKFRRQQTEMRLSWLANQIVKRTLAVYYIEVMQPEWLPLRYRHKYVVLARLGALVIFGVGGGQVGRRIHLVERLHWSWSKARKGFLNNLGFGLFMGIAFGLFMGIVFGLGSGLLFGLFMGIVFWLSFGLIGGLRGQVIEVRTVPNQGISRSIRSGLVGALFSGLSVGVVGALFGGLSIGLVGGGGSDGRLVFGRSLGLFAALLGALFGGLHYGGATVINHYTLRYLLYRQGSLPFRDLIPWLDHCCDRLFLRRVGGGYIFIHRMLLEHFARKYEEQTKQPE